MTTLRNSREGQNDQVDHTEMHIWGKLEYSDGGGSFIKVKGTGTEDQEAMVIHGATGFNLPSDSDAEVLLIAGSSDTNKKWAIASIPFKQQRKWGEGVGGVQSPVDSTRAVEINSKRTWVDDKAFATRNGEIEVDGNGNIYLRGNVFVSGNLAVSGNLTVTGSMFTNQPIGPAPVTVPGFSK